MSQQLHLSSLISAFALVCLCLFARADHMGDMQIGSGNGPVVQMLSQTFAAR